MKKTLLLMFIVLMNFISINAQLTESFDGITFPPAGWTSTVISTGDGSNQGIPGGTWDRTAAGINPPASPHSGTGMAWYNSFDFDPSSKADLITPAMNFAGLPKRVSFWMYRSATYPDQDSVTLYVNTTATATGSTFLGKIVRHINIAPIVGTAGWYPYYFDIPGSFNGASNYIIFRGNGQFGLDMYIDDIVVADQPNCAVLTNLTANNYNYAGGTATAAWTAAPGSPVGYEWAINTSGIDPASGTAVAGTSVGLTGITSNVVNYLFVRTNCGAGDFSTWVSISFAALPCAAILTPVDGATNVLQNQTFTWNAVAGATSYNIYLGTTAGTEDSLRNLTGISATIPNLLPLATYYWYILPRIGSVAALNSCTSNSFTIAAEGNLPPNNPCAGAITINSTNIAGNPVTATTIGATLTMPATVCNSDVGNADDDVWFEFTTASLTLAGTITITPGTTGGITDIVAQVYGATSCNNLGTPVLCADATTGTSPETLDLTTLLPNKHYYMRVYSYGANGTNQGTFTIVTSAGITLAVKLSTFTVFRNKKANILDWSTGQEINNSHFVIERSSDSRKFVSIGQVSATGNSNAVRSYSFTDNNPPKGINYYRLRTVDQDNLFKFSSIRSIRNEGIADVNIYPNPVRDVLSLNINADKAAKGQMVISDLSGKNVYSRLVKIGLGKTVLPINVDGFAAGTYIVKIQLNDDMIIGKFNKQ